MNSICRGFVLAASIALSGPTAAQTFPSRPITVIMSVGAGGTTDVMARAIAAKMQVRMGQPVLVENKPGAGTIIGSEAIIKAAPDGHTFGYSAATTAIHHLAYKDPRFNWARDTTPVIILCESGYGLAVNPQKLPVKNVTELVAMLKASPGKVNFGSSGVATSPHIVAELFKAITGTDIVHVPYKESPRATQAVISGEVELLFVSTNAAKPPFEAKQINLLAVTTRNRDPIFPQVPTLRESGVDMVNSLWFGWSGPAGIPRPVLAKLNDEINAVLKMPDLKDKLASMGLAVVGGSPEDLAKQVEEDAKGFRLVMERAKIEKL